MDGRREEDRVGCFRLYAMIGVAEKDRFCAVNLLEQQATHQLMRPGHGAEGDFQIRPGDQFAAMAIRINDFLSGMFAAVDIRLVDFKLEFGRLWDGDFARVILADEILKVDAFNPMTAARLVEPLGGWRRYKPELGRLMRAQLERIAGQPNLSKNVLELATKALG